jgi:hypothetical protein
VVHQDGGQIMVKQPNFDSLIKDKKKASFCTFIFRILGKYNWE